MSITENMDKVQSEPVIRGLQLPKQLELAEDPVTNWKLFRRRWENYMTLSNMESHPEIYKVALLHTCLGDEAMKLYDGFDFETPEDQRTVREIIDQFESFAIGQVNETYERAVFNRRMQHEGEPFENFLAALRILIKSCGFCDKCKDSLLRDRIVVGIRDSQTHAELVKQRSLTLTSCIDICRSADKATREETILRPNLINSVRQTAKADKEREIRFIKSCKYCGKSHAAKKEDCPAWKHICSKCNKSNHLEASCLSGSLVRKKRVSTSRPVRQLEEVDEHFVHMEDNIAWINTVTQFCDLKAAKCALEVDGRRVIFQIDTGSSVNLLPFSMVKESTKIIPSNRRLKMWNNSQLNAFGLYTAVVRNPRNDDSFSMQFVIVKEELSPLLGLQACLQMNLINLREDNIERVLSISLEPKFEIIFKDGIGRFPGFVKLHVNPAIVPVVSPPRRTPIALRAKLRQELDRLIKLNVIVSVTDPTEWVNQFVIVPKQNGSVRLCIDPVHLNKALQREHYTLPTVDDVLHELAESKVFTKCDLRWGFLHVELDEESSYLTTFQTPFGRFRWLRLPFGISVAPEIFQRKVHEIFGDLEGVEVVADDIIIHGKDEESHDKNLSNFFYRCLAKGVKLNPDKFHYKSSPISFLGHSLSEKGITADPAKTEAIDKFPTPSSVTELKRFLGMVNFLGRYVPNLAHRAEPLHNLLKADVDWNWAKSQEEAFKDIKSQVVQLSTLALFNDRLPVILECDASDYGIGAALYQDNKPVAFASKTLTATERRYAQIEKELLAVVIGLEKFHHFVYGRHITVHTDHKPLVAISTKPLYKAPKRLQTLLLRAKQYSFDLQYVPGKQLPVADALSRAPLGSDTQEQPTFFPAIQSVKFLPVSDYYLPVVQRHTAEDNILQEVKRFILEGWPDHKESVGPLAAAYFPYRDELAVSNGVIMRGDRIVIPTTLRQDIKKKIHAGHQGINACLARARELLFWPNMSVDIRQFIEGCSTCAAFAPAQSNESMIGHEIPPGPWLKLGADIFVITGRNYLVLIDYFSKFFEVDFLPDTVSSTVIEKLKHHFSRHGIPRVLVTDGGPQFISKQFQNFASSWGFKHIITSPGNSRSNGQAESAVKKVKNVLLKCSKSGEDPYLGLLALRNSVNIHVNSSPAQCIFGRATRTTLPTSPSHLDFSPPSVTGTHKKLLDHQNAVAQRHDRSAIKDLSQLSIGDQIRHKNPLAYKPQWEKGQVTKQLNPRTYEIETEHGSIIKRNRRFLKPSEEMPVHVNKSPIKQHQKQTTEIENYGADVRSPIVTPKSTPALPDTQSDPMPSSFSTIAPSYITRSGRHVKPPDKLDL